MAFDPVSLAIGGVSAIAQGIFGASKQSSANSAAKAAAAAQNKAAMQQWVYQNDTRKAQNRYNRETVAIQRANQNELLDYQEAQAMKDWSYQMQIRAFDYQNQVKAYQMRSTIGLAQLDFNSIASNFALQDTARWEMEQNIALDFEEKSTMVEYLYNQKGQQLQLVEAQYVKNQTGASGQADKQRAYVEGLKGYGAAKAKGASGLSAEAAAGAAIAETGAAIGNIIQSLFYTDVAFGMKREEITNNLRQINEKFYLDKAQIAVSRESLKAQGISARRNIAAQRFQNDLNAIASIGYAPSVPPVIPMPDPLPRPEIQDPFKIQRAPKPIASSAVTSSPIMAFASTALPGLASAAVSAYRPTGGNWGTMAGGPNMNLSGTSALGSVGAFGGTTSYDIRTAPIAPVGSPIYGNYF